MFHIITTQQLRTDIKKIIEYLENRAFIVTQRGIGKALILPYFDGCDEFLDIYLDDYRIFINRERLEEEFKNSYRSGPSDLIL